MLSYKFRLYPNREEERRLLNTLMWCRYTYNRLLEEWMNGRKNRFELAGLLPLWKEEEPKLKEVYSKCLQPEVDRLFHNLHRLAELRKRGRKVGRLRFKGERWFKTFTYNQKGFKIIPKNDKFGFLHLSKIGEIPIRLHREVEGRIKQVTVKLTASGQWYAFLAVESDSSPPSLTGPLKAIGIDVGLKSYASDSDGNEVINPRHLRNSIKRLRREQRRLSRKAKGSRNREKQRIKVSRLLDKIRNQRADFQHQVSRFYVNNYDLIVTEDLSPSSMVRNRRLSTSISDASWGSLNNKLAYKAVNAGKLFVQVDSRSTTQQCSTCGANVPKDLDEREHRCPECGIHISRDYNASLNILERGIEKVRSERPELTLADTRPLLHLMAKQAEWLRQEPSLLTAG